MSESKKALATKANKLRRTLAELDAKADDCRIRLAQIEARLDNREAPLSGLDQLWKLAPDKARERSSKHLCRLAWNKVPAADRPPVQTLLDAMAKWLRCDEWRKDGGQFVPAVDRWIREQRWEDAPAIKDAPSRSRHLPKPVPQNDPAQAASQEEIAEILGALKPRRMNS
jgi:hypothetical protein